MASPALLRRAAPALAAVLLLGGCAYAHRDRDIDRHPVVNTGVGATILYPGQRPAAPPPGPVTSPEAPRGGAAPGSAPVTWIGGAETDEEREIRVREQPLVLKALLAPFALVAAPFQAAAGWLGGDGEEAAAAGSAAAAQSAPAPAPQGAPATAGTPAGRAASSYDTRMLEQMERELESRGGGGAPGPSASPKATSTAAGPSIADELAALRRRAEGGASSPQPRAATPPEPRASGHSSRAAATPRRTEGERPLAAAHGTVDRDGDGNVDHWIFRAGGDIERELFDENGDGRPDRVLHYDAETHEVARVEEDGNGDGAMDTWTDYREGVLVRRRADSDHDGVVDTWAFYRDGAIARHERDSTGDGFRDRAAFYENGRLVREEHDADGDGRPDATLHYDDEERVTRREEDTDGDGTVDVISHYEAGRLQRRELLRADAATDSL